MTLHEICTPALLLDLDAVEHNMACMAEQAARHGVRLRPHAKTHKCGALALQQIAHGAIGVCCQTLGEAEVLVDHGVNDVLITSQVVDRRKLERLATLAGRAAVGVCVDHPENVDALAEAASAVGAPLDLLVEIDVGGGRCGVRGVDPALHLVRRIVSSRYLRFRGLQAYHGPAQHIRSHGERRAAIERSSQIARDVVELLARADMECQVVAGGGTGTCEFEMRSGVYNELQPGSYIFMDADYSRNTDETGRPVSQFRQSLFVYTQVISVARTDYAVVDAGLKAVAFDSGMPQVADMPDMTYDRPSDEHGALDIRRHSGGLPLGTKLRLVPGHCDPTVNLHDWLVGVRGERVESVWPIVARGALS